MKSRPYLSLAILLTVVCFSFLPTQVNSQCQQYWGVEWTAGVYDKGDTVVLDGVVYTPSKNNTKTVPPARNWLVVALPRVPVWIGSTNYLVGDKVSTAETVYECIASHSAKKPPNPTYWQEVEEGELINCALVTGLDSAGVKAVFTASPNDNLPDDYPANNGVDVYTITYTTVFRGVTIPVSSALVVPKGASSGTERYPLATYTHGTLLRHFDQPPSEIFVTPALMSGDVRHALMLGTHGMVTIVPDYIGLGDEYPEVYSGYPPYIDQESGAQMILDGVDAAVQFCSENTINLSGEFFQTSFSQGGHISIAAQEAFENSSDPAFDELKQLGLSMAGNSYIAAPPDISTAPYQDFLIEYPGRYAPIENVTSLILGLNEVLKGTAADQLWKDSPTNCVGCTEIWDLFNPDPRFQCLVKKVYHGPDDYGCQDESINNLQFNNYIFPFFVACSGNVSCIIKEVAKDLEGSQINYVEGILDRVRFWPNFSDTTITTVLEANMESNDVYHFAPTTETAFYFCEGDRSVNPANSKNAYCRMTWPSDTAFNDSEEVPLDSAGCLAIERQECTKCKELGGERGFGSSLVRLVESENTDCHLNVTDHSACFGHSAVEAFTDIRLRVRPSNQAFSSGQASWEPVSTRHSGYEVEWQIDGGSGGSVVIAGTSYTIPGAGSANKLSWRVRAIYDEPGVGQEQYAWTAFQTIGFTGNLLHSADTNLVVNSIVSDENDNMYVTGRFSGNLQINQSDADAGAVFNLSSTGGSDIFVAKLDETSALVWVRSYGQTMDDQGIDIEARSGAPEIFVSGTVRPLGSGSSGVAFGQSGNLVAEGNGPEGFVLRLNSLTGDPLSITYTESSLTSDNGIIDIEYSSIQDKLALTGHFADNMKIITKSTPKRNTSVEIAVCSLTVAGPGDNVLVAALDMNMCTEWASSFYLTSNVHKMIAGIDIGIVTSPLCNSTNEVIIFGGTTDNNVEVGSGIWQCHSLDGGCSARNPLSLENDFLFLEYCLSDGSFRKSKTFGGDADCRMNDIVMAENGSAKIAAVGSFRGSMKNSQTDLNLAFDPTISTTENGDLFGLLVRSTGTSLQSLLGTYSECAGCAGPGTQNFVSWDHLDHNSGAFYVAGRYDLDATPGAEIRVRSLTYPIAFAFMDNGAFKQGNADPFFITFTDNGQFRYALEADSTNDSDTLWYAETRTVAGIQFMAGNYSGGSWSVQDGQFSLVSASGDDPFVTPFLARISPSAPYQFFKQAVGLQGEEANGLTIYPNPTNGLLNLEFVLPFEADREVMVFDNVGRQVVQMILPGGQTNLHYDASGLSAGLYILVVDGTGFRGRFQVLD